MPLTLTSSLCLCVLLYWSPVKGWSQQRECENERKVQVVYEHELFDASSICFYHYYSYHLEALPSSCLRSRTSIFRVEFSRYWHPCSCEAKKHIWWSVVADTRGSHALCWLLTECFRSDSWVRQMIFLCCWILPLILISLDLSAVYLNQMQHYN